MNRAKQRRQRDRNNAIEGIMNPYFATVRRDLEKSLANKVLERFGASGNSEAFGPSLSIAEFSRLIKDFEAKYPRAKCDHDQRSFGVSCQVEPIIFPYGNNQNN